MGEVVISGGGGGMEFNWDAGAENVTAGTLAALAAEASSRAGGNDSIVIWEGFLPKMMLRVLLVEADDSTRQIITALLRKCSYQVAAVSDGLKAWEVLKRKPQNIDLILTEVDLPSISGFALLTLIMEHRICKNIPVIMMSSQDSISTVYKCMLRGAADFLVKPVRKNELRNLWQHVWRRKATSNSGLGMPDESVLQQKVEATAENHNMSKHSNDDMACIKRSREKESDDQSSCTKPELEIERAELDCVPDLPYFKRSKTSSTESVPTIIGHNNLTKEVQDYHVGAEGSSVTAGIDSNRNLQEDTELHGDWRCFDPTSQACGDNHALTHSSREAIDLIGAFDNNLKCINRSSSSYAGINNFDSLPSLDLSLKRSLPCGLTDKVTEERGSLNHSDASAFSRYVNKTPLPGHSTSPIACNQMDNQEANLSKSFSLHTVNSNADPPGLAIVSPSSTPLAFGQFGETENRSLPALIPVKRFGFQNTSNANGSLIPPAFYTSSGMSQMQSSDSVSHQEGSFQVSCNHASQNADDANDQSENKEKLRLKSPEEPCRVSSATEQTANSVFCNENSTNLHSLGPGSNGRLEPLPDSFRVHDGTSLKSIQREAALSKFRLKRKERCFEKKVRYESRKKLAEKRPRVKGQFVCRLSNEPVPATKSSLV